MLIYNNNNNNLVNSTLEKSKDENCDNTAA